jgi:hypothetical protein
LVRISTISSCAQQETNVTIDIESRLWFGLIVGDRCGERCKSFFVWTKIHNQRATAYRKPQPEKEKLKISFSDTLWNYFHQLASFYTKNFIDIVKLYDWLNLFTCVPTDNEVSLDSLCNCFISVNKQSLYFFLYHKHCCLIHKWALSERRISVGSEVENTAEVVASVVGVSEPLTATRVAVFAAGLELRSAPLWVETVVLDWLNEECNSTEMRAGVSNATSLIWSAVGEEVGTTNVGAKAQPKKTPVRVQALDVSCITGVNSSRWISLSE